MTPSDPTSWVRQCADRLQQQWPRVPREDLEDTALDLLGKPELRRLEPDQAASQWLHKGVLAD